VPIDLSALIAKLQAWEKHDFHGDRQLADEVLIADGWRCVPDKDWHGGIRWSYEAGNPKLFMSEDTRPHVILNLDNALGVVPLGHNVRLSIIGGNASAHVWRAGEIFRDEYEGYSPLATIALIIAALKAKQALQAKEAA
jgi:hypothetical protein